MSLAGFDHVFTSAVEVNLPGRLTIRVAPPLVTALLKIIAWVDDPYRRAKDLQDIRNVLRRYELAGFGNGFDAGSVASVAEGGRARSGDRSPCAPKSQLQIFSFGGQGGFADVTRRFSNVL